MGGTKLRVGMIGAGSMAKHHLEAWSKCEDARVVAIYNRTQSRSEALAREFSIPYICADACGLIRRDDVDAVSISMPHSLHRPLALAAIEAGKHVFCEKPLATTLADAREMWQKARTAGIKTGIQFGHRCLLALSQLRKLLQEGFVGRIQFLECSWCFDWARDPSFPLVWRFQRAMAGAGALADLGVYAIDAARWLIGEFSSVTGSLRTYVEERPILSARYSFDEVVRLFSEQGLPASKGMGWVENEDECLFLAAFTSGAHGVLRASRVHDDQRLTVYGSEGVLTWRLVGDELSGRHASRTRLDRIPLPADRVAPTIVSGFVDGIRDGVERSPSFYDGFKAQEVIDAVLESAKQRQWMPVRDTRPDAADQNTVQRNSNALATKPKG